MTNKEWEVEVGDVLASERVPWRVFSSWCDQAGSTCLADLTHTGNGKFKTLSVSLDRFATAAQRRAEILRQLQER